MSGHSHFKTVMHKKGEEDKKRGKIFSKLSKVISVAAKKGEDPNMNSELRMAIDQAKKANMPQDNVERAIKRGTGEIEGEILEEFCFEAYGPAKSAIIITGITSNKNRSLNEIKQILLRNNAKLAETGSVKWQFENMGIIIINPEERNKGELEITCIEAGAEDTRWEGEFLEVYIKPDKLEPAKKQIEAKEINIESAVLGWKAKEEININEKEMAVVEKLFNALDENDDVQEIYSNVKI